MVPVDLATAIDVQDSMSWYIDGLIVRLRLWGTSHAYPLPDPGGPLIVGSASTCDIQLYDKDRRLSREHARLIFESVGWEIHDLDSKNGVWVDGARTTKPLLLQAGAKIQLGGLTLIAESLKFIALRALVCRLLGWAPSREPDVDEALQNLRDGATQRTPLVLIGAGNLVPVAARLHRATLGPSAPFLVDDGGAIDVTIQAAKQGTLCVASSTGSRASAILDAVRALEISARPRLVLCASKPSAVATLSGKPGRLAVISMPPMSTRADEISRLVHETAEDLVRELGTQSNGFTMHDLERLPLIRFSSIAELEETLRRLIAMRIWGVTQGAKKLGLKHPSLLGWARSRKRKLST